MAEEPAKGPPDAAALEPGAPVPPDAVDSELLSLPPPRRPRSPLLALGVIGLSVLLLVRLGADLAYALRPATPEDLGDARQAASTVTAQARLGHYVSVRGMPDHRNTLAFEAKGDRTRSQLFRLLGTGSRLLVVTSDPAERPSFTDQFTGRLLRFDDLPYAQTIRDAYQQQARAVLALDLPPLRALPPGPLPVPLRLPDRAGEAVTLGGDDELRMRVTFPRDVRVLLPKTKFPSEPDARHEVERLGLPAGPGVETEDGYGYVLRLPEGTGRNDAVSRIDAVGLLFQQRTETYRAPVRKVATGPDGLVLPGPKDLPQPTAYVPAEGAPTRLVPSTSAQTLLPWDRIQAVTVSEPVVVAPDAVVVLDGESPAGVRFALPLMVLLVGFIGFNLWYLWRGLRERQKT